MKYVVKGTGSLHYNGKQYAPGDEVDLPEAEAARIPWAVRPKPSPQEPSGADLDAAEAEKAVKEATRGKGKK